jgi:outer membrane protein OmpU
MSDSDNRAGGATRGNQFSMGDSITFSGSGEMDNGMTISVSYELDGDANPAGTALNTNGNQFDDHSMTLDTNGMGTITFAGHGGSSAMSAIDDTTPNAYEESWDAVLNADTGTRVNGLSGNNMFTYTSPDVSGAVVTVAYLNAEAAAGFTAVSYMDFAVAVNPEMVEGLTLGYGQAETEAAVGTVIDDTTMYIKYVYGSATVGYSESESDGAALASDLDFEAFGISYAVNDDFTVAYNQSESKNGALAVAQEASGISASYTAGGMTIAGVMNTVDNVQGNAAVDAEGYELNLSFAF